MSNLGEGGEVQVQVFKNLEWWKNYVYLHLQDQSTCAYTHMIRPGRYASGRKPAVIGLRLAGTSWGFYIKHVFQGGCTEWTESSIKC